MRRTLPTALKLMFGDEGGYSNRATDSGGPTKYGITHRTLAAHRGVRSVTADQVKALTLKEAEEIYVKSYWRQSGGDVLPVGLDYAAFDFGVNSGPGTAVRKLQKILGVAQDGVIGKNTLYAVSNYPGGTAKLIRDYCEERMRYLRSLTNPRTGFPVNGRGWTIRVTGIDPKGQWATKPGVVGDAIALHYADSHKEYDKGASATVTPPVTEPATSTPPANAPIKEVITRNAIGLLVAAGVLLLGAAVLLNQ